ncbi:MAG: glutamine amidotransferase [Micavibrio sp.]|nr:MAG: glutamine amidotransferase [Micavibrio sp.]
MFLVIDNYDSFVYNLARYVELAGGECEVVRNDSIRIEDVKSLQPDGIILSPGPCTPAEAGICVELVKELGAYTPILGVCLGHQCIGEAYGGRTIRGETPVHGKACTITHNGSDIFDGIPSPMQAGRYHSLIIELPDNSPLMVTANTDEIIMAMQHKTHPVYGLQFHPESVLTPHGQAITQNFTTIAQHWQGQNRRAA